MNPHHHPAADVLGAYASGTLAPGFGLVVGAHVEACAVCRARVGAFEAASGEALADLPSAEIAPDALTQVLARLGGARPTPADNRPLIERLPLKRRRWVAPGVWSAAVDTPRAPTDRVYVLSVASGMPTARHAHSGAEFCTVLQGSFRDDTGVYAAGDFAAVYGDFDHQPEVVGEAACVCLFATEGRLKAQGLIGRLAFAFADV